MARTKTAKFLYHLPICVLLFWVFAVVVSLLWDFYPNVIQLQKILVTPNLDAWLGYDDLGRNVLARLLNGARVSMLVAVVVTIVTMLFGTTIGLISGFYGGKVDRLIMQITDVFMAFPGILLAIALAAVLGAGLGNLIIALCITSWVGYARLTRAQALSLRNRQHVLAAESLGASVPRLMFKHILPLLAAPLVVEATYSIAGLIIAEASLSFLGLGIQAPNASWGSMLRDGVRYMLVAPHYVLAVGLSLMSLVLAINLLGDQLRDYLDIKADIK